jgi:hypothetical protein
MSLSQCGNCRLRSDAMGHERRFRPDRAMSALTSRATAIADMCADRALSSIVGNGGLRSCARTKSRLRPPRSGFPGIRANWSDPDRPCGKSMSGPYEPGSRSSAKCESWRCSISPSTASCAGAIWSPSGSMMLPQRLRNRKDVRAPEKDRAAGTLRADRADPADN